MTLVSELAEWKRKKAEAEAKLKTELPTLMEKEKWGNASRIAEENINRVQNVLAVAPWTDEIEAEDMRHFKARESIYAKYPKK